MTIITAAHRNLLVTAISATALLMGSQAHADESGVIEEVIVTAQKRKQNILDIPFAISAIDEEEIKDRGARDIKDLQYSIPGLSITNNLPGQDRVQIRGASSGSGIGLPTVGRYVDEVSVASGAIQRTLDVPLLDVERIEVLRGPQGTLYGAGSIGGTIRYITNSPDLNEAGGSLGIGVNSIDDGNEGYEVNGVINLPIIEDKLAVRIAASTEDLAGWIDNTDTGKSDINESERDFVRTKILFQPNYSFDASLMWMHYDFEQDNNNHELSVSGGGLGLLNVDDRQATSDRIVDTPLATPVEDKWDLFNLELNLSLENADVVSSTGYLDRTINFTAELANAFLPPGVYGSFEIQDRKAEILTQEIRVNSSWDNPLNYMVGVFYRTADTSETQIFSFGGPPSVSGGTAPVDSDSWAVFGELSYDFFDTFTASLGLRYFEEEQEPLTLLLGGPAPVDVSPEDQSFDSLTPKISLLWRVSDSTSVYATISKGFRSGGINGLGSSIPSFEPEEALLYEIGGRGALFGGLVYVDAAVYYMDYDDVQVSIVENFRARTTNVDSASGPGADLAVRVNLADNLSLDLTGGYVGREYDKINTVGASNVAEGDASQYTPKYTASASLAYDFNWTGSLAGMARFDLSYADEFSVFLRSFPPQPVIETDPLTYLGLRIGVSAENWRVVLSADNLLDERDEVFPGGAFSLDTYSRPRTISLKVDHNF